MNGVFGDNKQAETNGGAIGLLWLSLSFILSEHISAFRNHYPYSQVLQTCFKTLFPPLKDSKEIPEFRPQHTEQTKLHATPSSHYSHYIWY